MPADLPPPPPPALTAEQHADLGCLRVGLTLLATKQTSGGYAKELVRVRLARLRRSDDSPDWLSLAKPDPAVTYGDFMAQMNSCDMPPKARE